MPHIVEETRVRKFLCDGAVTKYAVVVEGTSDGQVKLPGAADAGSIVGVALEAGADGDYISVALQPSIVPCVASAAIARGAVVSIAGTTGKIKTAAPAVGSNTYLVGRAREAATADGDQISVELVGASVMQG